MLVHTGVHGWAHGIGQPMWGLLPGEDRFTPSHQALATCSSSSRRGLCGIPPFTLLVNHVNQYCHYAGLIQATMLLRVGAASLSYIEGSKSQQRHGIRVCGHTWVCGHMEATAFLYSQRTTSGVALSHPACVRQSLFSACHCAYHESRWLVSHLDNLRLCLPFPHRSTEITDVCYGKCSSVDIWNLNSGPQVPFIWAFDLLVPSWVVVSGRLV